jgi:hypothetical protein
MASLAASLAASFACHPKQKVYGSSAWQGSLQRLADYTG